MKKIWVVLLVLGLVMLGNYCQSAENAQSIEVSKVTLVENTGEENEISLATLEMEDIIKSEIQLKGENQSDDEGDDNGDGDDDEGEGESGEEDYSDE